LIALARALPAIDDDVKHSPLLPRDHISRGFSLTHSSPADSVNCLGTFPRRQSTPPSAASLLTESYLPADLLHDSRHAIGGGPDYTCFFTHPSSHANFVAPQTCRRLDRTSQNRKLRRHLPRHHHSCCATRLTISQLLRQDLTGATRPTKAFLATHLLALEANCFLCLQTSPFETLPDCSITHSCNLLA
ncbi:hypothetical protein KCV06_g229, partial [Aureobasidium melanogenum]